MLVTFMLSRFYEAKESNAANDILASHLRVEKDTGIR
jgi:hypothetical protein